MKKIICLVVSLMLIMSVSVSANTTRKELSKYEIHEAMINEAMAEKNQGISEYDILNNLKAMSTEQLKQEKLTKSDVVEIENRMLNELERRALLSDKDLTGLGYSEKEISELKSMTGKITLEAAASKGVMAECYVYNSNRGHTYDGSKTHFKVQYGWHWDKSPAMQLNDTAGIGWAADGGNIDFWINDSKTNELDVVYYAPGYDYTKTYDIVETNMSTAKTVFPLGKYNGANPAYARNGVGIVNLACYGKSNNAKFKFIYGHNYYGPNITLSSSGINFSLKGAEVKYQDDIIHSIRNFY